MSILDTSLAPTDNILSNTRGKKTKLRRQAISVGSGIKSSGHFLGIVSIKSQASYQTTYQKARNIQSLTENPDLCFN